MLEKYNFHWRSNFFYNFPKHRNLFQYLIQSVDKRQIVSVSGLRRTGKTTLLKQLIDYLISIRKVAREDIIFFSFDENQVSIEDVIAEYEARAGKELLGIKTRLYVFLDGIQKLDNWQNQIKYYYDQYDNIKFFISGSASLFIKKKSRESLAGRIFEYSLVPLSFKEFLIFRGKEDLVEKRPFFRDTLQKEFTAYQKRQFVEVVSESEEDVGRYVQTIIEKIVYQDIPKIFPIENADLLMRILKIISSYPGMLLDYMSLSRDIGISRVTLSNYFYYLEESFLIKKLYNFSKNMLTSEKKMKKVYLSTTSFFPFLNPAIDETRLVENLMVVLTDARFFWRTPQKYEVDIITGLNDVPVPVEVKFANLIDKKDTKNLLRFSGKFDCKKALMITRDTAVTEMLELKDGRKIDVTMVPAWLFSLK
ncbi:MAG: ATP-binding protein [Deltaproteobacteria bacterium]|nr:ATP-binding protein [Deltaproteobacteria bacterium]